MFRVIRTAALGIGMGALLAAYPAAGATAGGEKTRACSKCAVTYVKVAQTDARGRVVRYTSHPHMKCPECKTALQNFFATGKLQHACTHCPAAMETCDAHT